jgi:hypothetical protein
MRRHVLAQQLGGALGHRAEEQRLEALRRTLQCQRHLALVGAADDRGDRGRQQIAEILEGEHQRADALGAFRRLVVQRVEHRFLGRAVERVEQLGHRLVRIALLRTRQIGHELGLERLLDLVDHVLLHRLHAQHAHHHVDREVARQLGEHAGRMVGAQLGKDHRHGLRIFVLQRAGEHGLADVGQLVPHRAARGTTDVFHDLLHLLARQDAGEQALGRLVAAVHRRHRRDFTGELDEQMLHHLRGYAAQAGDGRGQFLHFVGGKLFPDRAAMFLAQRKHQGSGPLRAVEALEFGRFGNRRHQGHFFRFPREKIAPAHMGGSGFPSIIGSWEASADRYDEFIGQSDRVKYSDGVEFDDDLGGDRDRL